METDQNTPQDPTNSTTTNVQPPAATSPTPGAQPDGTTLDTRQAAASSTTLSVGDRVTAAGNHEDVEAVVLEHALVTRLADLAQRVRDFVGDEARPLVNELMAVAADVRQYL